MAIVNNRIAFAFVSLLLLLHFTFTSFAFLGKREFCSTGEADESESSGELYSVSAPLFLALLL